MTKIRFPVRQKADDGSSDRIPRAESPLCASEARLIELEKRIAQLEKFLGFKEPEEDPRPVREPAQKRALDEIPSCPDCGAVMKFRKPRPGGRPFQPFWGCSTYPRCRGTMSEEDWGRKLVGADDAHPGDEDFGPGPDGWDW